MNSDVNRSLTQFDELKLLRDQLESSNTAPPYTGVGVSNNPRCRFGFICYCPLIYIHIVMESWLQILTTFSPNAFETANAALEKIAYFCSQGRTIWFIVIINILQRNLNCHETIWIFTCISHASTTFIYFKLYVQCFI